MKRHRAHLKLIRQQKGQALVEFAMVVTLFLFLLMGIIDFGRFLYIKHSLDKATREAARAAVVELDSAASVNTAKQLCQDILTQPWSPIHADSGHLSVEAEVVQVGGADALSVQASYLFRSFFTSGPLMIIPPVNVSSTSVMRREG